MRACFPTRPDPVPHTRIKICGITRAEDAREVADAGADAIGLVFYRRSSRVVTPVQAAEIAAAIPPFITVVALFVNEQPDEVERILDTVPVDLIQFHGEESAGFCRQFRRPWIKALRVRPGVDIRAACDAYHGARALLLDSWQQGVPGGTGLTFDWGLAPRDLGLPVVLAGGLTEENVGEAICALRPAAVDVSGGVETSPGLKCAEKIRRFVSAVRAADSRLNGKSDEQ